MNEITLPDFTQYITEVGQNGFGGFRVELMFDNGYGASVIRGGGTYGDTEGLFELAVLDSNKDICYSTPITDDVLGWLSPSDVRETLLKIKNLPPKQNLIQNAKLIEA